MKYSGITLEYILFFAINILFGCTVFAFGYDSFVSTVQEDFLGQKASNFILIFLILRLFILFIIFVLKPFFPNIHLFLYKFTNNKKYANSVFKICLWIDLPILFIMLLFVSFIFLLHFSEASSFIKYIFAIVKTTFLVQFIFPGGLTVLYAAFWVEYNLIKKIIKF